jgi:hypothetical protein
MNLEKKMTMGEMEQFPTNETTSLRRMNDGPAVGFSKKGFGF